jgi:hypothetical protein
MQVQQPVRLRPRTQTKAQDPYCRDRFLSRATPRGYQLSMWQRTALIIGVLGRFTES